VASEEEVKITIRTVGDTSGAQQVTNAMKETQAAADTVQQQLTDRARAANTTLESLMKSRQQTLEAFNTAAKMAEKFAGTAPTLGPDAFGIGAAGPAAAAAGGRSLAMEALMRAQQPQLIAGRPAPISEDPQAQARLFQARGQQQRQFDALIAERARSLRGQAIPGADLVPPAALEALNKAMATTKEVGTSANVSAIELARFGGAALGVGFGLSAFSSAGALVHAALQSIIGGTVEYQRVATQNANVLGQQAAGFRVLASTISDQAGVTQQSLLEAGTAAAQFSRSVGLGPEQVDNLTAVSVLLARIQGTTPSTTITQLTAALQGNGQAAAALGIQLDAAYVAFTQLGGATAEVFNQLSPSTQAALRYQSALEQIAKQAGEAATPQQELAKQTGAVGAEWEKFVGTTGPGVVGALAKILEGVNGTVTGLQHMNDALLEQRKQSGGLNPVDLNAVKDQVTGVAQGVGDALSGGTEILRGAVGDRFNELGTAAKEANDALRDTTGFDAQAAAANVAAAAVEKAQQGLDAAGQAIDAAKQKGAELIDVVTAPLRAADAAERSAASSAEDARRAQLATLAGAVAGPSQNLAAAQRNEVAAARALVDLKRESIELTAREAGIRLEMLPAQQRMTELQNETNRAQIEATQRALPASRALQDLQNAIEEQRLIATSGSRSIEERTAAQRQGALLLRQTPEAELAARRAEASGLPAQRAAQDVGLQAQLLALQQAAALNGPEFQKQQISLLAQIADAAKSAAQQTIELSIQAINVIVQQAGAITEDDEKRIAALAGDQVAKVIHAAVQSVNARSAAPQLVGAGG